MTLRSLSLLLAVSATAFVSCKKHTDDASPAVRGPMTLEFQTTVGDGDLLKGKKYVTATSDTFSITDVRYYISHIVLKKDDGTTYAVPADSSYFLLAQYDDLTDNPAAELVNLPPGNYTGVTFTLGVDSATAFGNGTKPDAIDPRNPDTGGKMVDFAPDSTPADYHFYNLAGTNVISGGSLQFLYYSWGLRGQQQTMLKTVTLTFPTPAIVGQGRHPEVHTANDLLKVMGSTAGAWIWGDPSGASSKLADNAAGSFTVLHVHND